MLKGLLLDLDGTLANTEEYSYAYARNKPLEEILEYKLYRYMLPILKIVTWEEFIELYTRAQKEIKQELVGTAASHNRYLYIQRTLELCGINFVPDIIQRSVDFYFDEMLKKTVLFDGVLDVLKQFKYNQLTTCIVTDFTADVQIKKIRKLGITKYIDFMVTSEEVGADKPHVEQAVVALKKMHLTQDEVVMIGNNPKTDIELAQRIAMKSVLFDNYGYYEDKSAMATYYVKNFSEIPALLKMPPQKYSRKKLLVLDFIGTLTNEKHITDEVLRPFVHKELSYLRAEYELFKRNQISEAEFWYKMGIGDIEKARKSICAAITIRKSVIKMVERLSKSYKIVLLSDFPAVWGNMILQERAVKQLFDTVIFTSDLAVHKPNKQLFERVLTGFTDICPENITVVDNNAAALASCRELLMRTIYVRNDHVSHNTAFVPDDVISDVLELEKVVTK